MLPFFKSPLPLVLVAAGFMAVTGCGIQSTANVAAAPVAAAPSQRAVQLNDVDYAKAVLENYFAVIHPQLSPAMARFEDDKKPKEKALKTVNSATRIVNGMVGELEKRRPEKDFSAQHLRLTTDLRQMAKGLALLQQGAKEKNRSLVRRGRILVDANLSDLVLLSNQLESQP